MADANLSYLFTAYAIFWSLTFVLVFSIWARQRRLDRDVTALRERLDQEEKAADLT